MRRGDMTNAPLGSFIRLGKKLSSDEKISILHNKLLRRLRIFAGIASAMTMFKAAIYVSPSHMR